VPVAQQGIEQEQEQELEPESASQISEQIPEFGAFKASIIYIAFILNDRLSLMRQTFVIFIRNEINSCLSYCFSVCHL
jgi:hypothetical protein